MPLDHALVLMPLDHALVLMPLGHALVLMPVGHALVLFFFLEKNELQGVEALTAQRHVQAEQNNQVQQKQTHSKPQNL